MEAAIISASVALLVFSAGRWLEYRAKQTQMLREKLEVLYSLLERLYEHTSLPEAPSSNTEDELHRFQKELATQAGLLAKTLYQPKMIVDLYFPSAEPRFTRIANALGKMNNWMHDYADPNLPYKIEVGSKYFDEMHRAIVNLKNYLRDEQKFLIKSFGHEK
jgi:hypothetical protein